MKKDRITIGNICAQANITNTYESGLKYHKTDGGAEYLNAGEESVIRIDGQEFEILSNRLKEQGFERIKIGSVVINL